MIKLIKKSALMFFITLILVFAAACTNKVSEVTIKFDSNGGDTVESIKYDGKTDIKVPDDPSKEGYVFVGWYFDKATLEESFTVAALKDKNITEDITVYAKWDQKNETFKVIYETNGGSDVAEIDVAKGTKVTTPSVTKKGHTLDGFYTSSSFDVKWDFEVDPVNENLTLYAKWAVNQYTISFNTNGGSNVDDIKLDYDANVAKPTNPKKTGFTFGGWYNEASLVNQFVFKTMPEQNITLFAKWDEEILTDVTITETFETLQNEKDQGNNFSEYQDNYFTGDTDIIWDLTNVRIDLGMKEGGNAITLGGFGNDVTEAGMGRIYGESIPNGIKRLEFEGRLPFSPNSTYPQGPGKDKASSVKIKVFINGILIETLQFVDDKAANKGVLFTIENLNIVGDFSLSIEVSSGHRLTLDNISWDTNKNGVVDSQPINIDFESNLFDYDNDEMVHDFNGTLFMLKEVHTLIMHNEKEKAYMDPTINGQIAARFRGDKDDFFSTPVAYMYNIEAFDSVNKLTFDARLFGSDVYFGYESVINIYYKDDVTLEWTKLDTDILLTETFTGYEVEVNKTNVQLKIEVLNGKVNIDNIVFA